jgi:serine/threonine-protein kinase
MAAAPVLLMIGVYFASPDFANVLHTNPDFSGLILEVGMLMALAATAAVWGSHTMGHLRREAFEARQLNQYRLKRLLGEGGMGEVYLAEHLLLKRPCAIKLIRPDKAGDSRALARFEREVQATARLTHLNTVEIYDYGRADDGTFYYVMEYLSGLHLGQLVELHGPLPAERVIHLLTQTCDALREAHAQGLVHRDIKPANVFAAHRGGVYDVAKLLDFGLVKPITSFSETALTLEGTITGSPLYMAPEQITGQGLVDARSDIYSLGVVAYYVLTGRPPFVSQQPMQVMLAHAAQEPVPPSHHVGDVPEDLERVVLRCLEKDPEKRFQSAEEMRQALLECRAADGWTRETATRWWECHGCPKKKALDAAVLQTVGS